MIILTASLKILWQNLTSFHVKGVTMEGTHLIIRKAVYDRPIAKYTECRKPQGISTRIWDKARICTLPISIPFSAWSLRSVRQEKEIRRENIVKEFKVSSFRWHESLHETLQILSQEHCRADEHGQKNGRVPINIQKPIAFLYSNDKTDWTKDQGKQSHSQ